VVHHPVQVPGDDLKHLPVEVDGFSHGIDDHAFTVGLARPGGQEHDLILVPWEIGVEEFHMHGFHAQHQVGVLNFLGDNGPGAVGRNVKAVFLADLPGFQRGR